MREPEERYRRLIKALLCKRVLGPVSEADEGRAGEQIDQAWFEMTATERESAERWANAPSQNSVPTELPLVDQELQERANVLPRITR